MIGIYLTALSLSLLGYAVLGKSFAYIGVKPLYIGEWLLGLAVLVLCLDPKRALTAFSDKRSSVAVLGSIPMIVWGAIRTLPWLDQYGMDALRDSVVWAYALFGIAIYVLVCCRPRRFLRLFRLLCRFCGVYPWLMALLIGLVSLEVKLPSIWPGAPPLGTLKPGDIGVYISLCGLLFVLGFIRWPGVGWGLSLAIAFVWVASLNRGGALSAICPVALAVVLYPGRTRRVIAPIIIVSVLAVALWNLNGGELGNSRVVAGRQMFANLASVFGTDDQSAGGLEGNKQWRLAWWSKIADYTFRGEYFWVGKGFGVNLADNDGFQTSLSTPLRSPHSAFMTMLARAGVPGLAFWLLSQVSWLWVMLRAHVKARRHKESWQARLFAFFILAWLAFTLNASFDVFLEGPTGGIWYWTLLGFGLGAASVFDRSTSPQRQPRTAGPTGLLANHLNYTPATRSLSA
jgi:hypothetical protein